MSDHELGLPEYTLAPFMRRIRIQGYKSIEFCDVQLHPLTILVGRNSAGKSNFMDALEFLAELMDRRATEVVNDRRGWRSIKHHAGNNGKIEFYAEFCFNSGLTQWIATFSFALDMGDENQIRIIEESLVLEDGERKVGYECSDGQVDWSGTEYFMAEPDLFNQSENNNDNKLESPQLFKRRRYDRLLLSVIGTQPFIDLAERLRTSRVYNFAPEQIRKHQPMSASPWLERDGRNLARAIEGIREIQKDDVERVKSYLQEIVPDIDDFFIKTYGDFETLRFRMRSSSSEPRPLEFDASSMSDGTLRVLASLVAAYQYAMPIGHPGFVGMEEPETALHPAATQALVDALDEATQRTQILLTTHSPDLLSSRDIHPSQVLVVRNRDGKSQITPLDPASREIVQKELYSLADLQRMDKLDLDEAYLKRPAQLRQEAS